MGIEITAESFAEQLIEIACPTIFNELAGLLKQFLRQLGLNGSFHFLTR